MEAGSTFGFTVILQGRLFHEYADAGVTKCFKQVASLHELSGIDVKKVTVLIVVVMGILSAIAAVITTARLNAGANSMGMLSELSVIAAAVIGGTSLAGGVGTIAGAILGAVIMQSLENGMVLLGVSSPARQILIGLVLIAAVWFDATFRRKG